MNAAEKQRAPKSAVARLIALIVVVIALFLTMKFLPVQQWLCSFNDWVGQMGAAGILIFIVLYAVATVLLAPGAILTIDAGFAFGLWKGFVAVSAGATLAFRVARCPARCCIFISEPPPKPRLQPPPEGKRSNIAGNIGHP